MKANIWNHSEWVAETEPDVLRRMYGGLLRDAGFKVLDFVDYKFKPYGYTALWLLGESHFAVHTFPEFGRTYIELSSCNREYFAKFLEAIDA